MLKYFQPYQLQVLIIIFLYKLAQSSLQSSSNLKLFVVFFSVGQPVYVNPLSLFRFIFLIRMNLYNVFFSSPCRRAGLCECFRFILVIYLNNCIHGGVLRHIPLSLSGNKLLNISQLQYYLICVKFSAQLINSLRLMTL